ncbi:hypothetical protein [Helicobacter sp. 11S02629-2]|uniref:hypothetical protein n=1 Tax=Helicobacter sp. 11S02629-2 TaxID=1476195 RepID=UPI000BA7DDF5|nr:hypothetical protein [Helicobacter sp. 11S02629-2]PAF42390.1 hypothetical protein BKH40_07920 [Helicobacter sp. 11S02629-2]
MQNFSKITGIKNIALATSLLCALSITSLASASEAISDSVGIINGNGTTSDSINFSKFAMNDKASLIGSSKSIGTLAMLGDSSSDSSSSEDSSNYPKSDNSINGLRFNLGLGVGTQLGSSLKEIYKSDNRLNARLSLGSTFFKTLSGGSTIGLKASIGAGANNVLSTSNYAPQYFVNLDFMQVFNVTSSGYFKLGYIVGIGAAIRTNSAYSSGSGSSNTVVGAAVLNNICSAQFDPRKGETCQSVGGVEAPSSSGFSSGGSSNTSSNTSPASTASNPLLTQRITSTEQAEKIPLGDVNNPVFNPNGTLSSGDYQTNRMYNHAIAFANAAVDAAQSGNYSRAILLYGMSESQASVAALTLFDLFKTNPALFARLNKLPQAGTIGLNNSVDGIIGKITANIIPTVTGKISSLQSELNTATSQSNSKQSQLDSINQQLTALTKQKDSLATQLAAQQAQSDKDAKALKDAQASAADMQNKLQRQIDTLNTTKVSLEGEIKNLNTTKTTLEGKIASLKEANVNAQNSIDSLTTSNKDIQEKLNKANKSNETQATNITTLESQIDNLKQQAKEAQEATAQAKQQSDAKIAQIQAQYKDASSSLDELKTQYATNLGKIKDAVSKLQSTTSDASSTTQSLKDNNADMSAQLSSILSSLQTQAGTIKNLSDTTKTQAETIEKLRSNGEKLQETINSLTTNKEGLGSTIDTLTKTNSALLSKIQDVTAKIATLDGDRKNTEATADELLTNLSSQLDKLKAAQKELEGIKQAKAKKEEDAKIAAAAKALREKESKENSMPTILPTAKVGIIAFIGTKQSISLEYQYYFNASKVNSMPVNDISLNYTYYFGGK